MKTNQAGEGDKGAAANTELKPKDAVRRILEAAGAEVTDKEAYWLGYHMERFVNHTRKHGELLEFPVAVEAYLAFFKQGNPKDWQLDQLKQALVLFGRGTERWRWMKAADGEQMTEYGGQKSNPMAGPQGWVLRYRVKASGVNGVLVSAQGEVSPKGPPPELEAWIEGLRRAVCVRVKGFAYAV